MEYLENGGGMNGGGAASPPPKIIKSIPEQKGEDEEEEVGVGGGVGGGDAVVVGWAVQYADGGLGNDVNVLADNDKLENEASKVQIKLTEAAPPNGDEETASDSDPDDDEDALNANNSFIEIKTYEDCKEPSSHGAADGVTEKTAGKIVEGNDGNDDEEEEAVAGKGDGKVAAEEKVATDTLSQQALDGIDAPPPLIDVNQN